jgi:hypothetical protein
VSAEPGAAESGRCGSCLFLRNVNPNNGRGVCRRYPTAVIVGVEEWCGEFSAKEAFILETGESR